MTPRNPFAHFCLWLATCWLAVGAVNVKTIGGVAIANVKSVQGVAKANVKTVLGVDNTSAGGATYLLSESFDGSEYDLVWSESQGTPNGDYVTSPAPLDGTGHSLRLTDSGTDPRADSPTYTANAVVEEYFLLHILALPSGTDSVAIIRGSTTSLVTLQISATGTCRVVIPGGNSASTSGTMGVGTTYEIWLRYAAGTGANGFGSVGFSSDGTRPTGGANFTSKADGTATANADNTRLTAASGMDVIIDKLRIDDTTIVDDPS